jgi:formylglycine-generating enzyme required for sulfatase activity
MSTASLQTMQKEALDIYELAQVARFRATAEQERAESLLSSIQATEQAARDLLQKVGLAHIVGTPLQLDENAAPIRRSDQVLATAFADVQLAQANLRTTLLRLGQSFANEGNWTVAQSVLKPLLDDQQAPLYAEALKLLQQIYLRANQDVLTGEEWPQPQEIQQWLARNTDQLGLIEWLCETYYQIARQALQDENLPLAEEYLSALRKLNPNYRDANKLLYPGFEMVSPKDGMVMLYVPAGEFLMGSRNDDPHAHDNEKPQHSVYLDAYWIDKTPVTNAMFAKFVAETRYQAEGGWSMPRGKENHPVVYVSWDDAVAYANWAGRRLPTEAEWEKAAGGTDGRKYPWGNNRPTPSLANTSESGIGDTTPVGNYPAGASEGSVSFASPYGALDMAGNVWEWCNDNFEANYYASSPKANPQGAKSIGRKVLRGGSWDLTARDARARSRLAYNAYNRDEDWGFRCVR